jgi:uncharacterized protein (TIGR03663 family)
MTELNYSLFEDEWTVADSRPGWLTVERAAYVAIGLLAAGLRFFQLGLRPLAEGEAVQTLSAFRFVHGTPAGASQVPALFTGNVLGFGLIGASDISARWLPALLGLILALLPYGLRHRLGRGGALAASLLLAVSPSLVYFSRSLDGAIPVATCGLALVVGLINYSDSHRPGFLYLAAAALGLGLTAGPGIYSLLLIGILFGLLLYAADHLLGREAGWSSLAAGWEALRGEKGLLARSGAVLAATFGLVAMTFVLNPSGVGYAADLIGTWAKGFLPEEGGQPFVYPLLLLLRYESLALSLGLIEMGRWALSRRQAHRDADLPGPSFPFTAILSFWAVTAFLIVLVSGHRPAGNILLVVVPLALLAGQGVERAWRWIGRRLLWPEASIFAAITAGLLVFFYLQVAAYGLTNNASTFTMAGITLYNSVSYLLLASLALLLLAGLAIITAIWRGGEVVLAGGWLTLILVLGLFGFRSTWSLNFAHTADPRELMVLQTTAPDVRLLVERLEALSLDQSGDAHTLPITAEAATGPALAWYLRDFEALTVVESLSAPPDTMAALTLAAQDLPIGETFRGQGFPLRSRWLPWGLWGQDLVRWLLFGEGSLPVVDQEVVLWVMSEL